MSGQDAAGNVAATPLQANWSAALQAGLPYVWPQQGPLGATAAQNVSYSLQASCTDLCITLFVGLLQAGETCLSSREEQNKRSVALQGGLLYVWPQQGPLCAIAAQNISFQASADSQNVSYSLRASCRCLH